jgi:hypothetical protein
MNIANEIDLAMDEAVKEHLKHLFGTYFMDVGDTKLESLKASLKQLENDAEAAVKAIDTL